LLLVQICYIHYYIEVQPAKAVASEAVALAGATATPTVVTSLKKMAVLNYEVP